MENKKWDAFISHASEDTDSIVRDLTTELQKFHLYFYLCIRNID